MGHNKQPTGLGHTGLGHTGLLVNDVESAVAFYPTDVPGVIAFWDSSITSSLVLAGTAVISWEDQANGHLLTDNGNAAQRPALVAAALNGNDILTFDGASDWLRCNSINRPNPGTTPTWYFAVFRQNGYTGFDTLVASGNAAAYRIAVFQSGVSPNMAQNSGATANNNATLAVGAWARMESLFSFSVADYLKLGANTVTGGIAGNSIDLGISVGSRGGSAGTFMQLSLASLGIWPALPSVDDRNKLDSWVLGKYGAILV